MVSLPVEVDVRGDARGVVGRAEYRTIGALPYWRIIEGRAREVVVVWCLVGTWTRFGHIWIE